MTDFIHLHVHSDYSLLRSTASVKKLVDKASSLGMKHLALTDYGYMYGIPEFVKTCEEAHINPIIGCEFILANGYIVLLASNEEGYQNLMKLSSIACAENKNLPTINEQLLEKYHKGLIGLSGIWYKNMPDTTSENEEEKIALRFQEILGTGNFYLELLEHGIEFRKSYNSKLINISKRTGIPIVAGNDVHYLEREDAKAHSVLLCLNQKKTIDNYEKGLFTTNDFYFKTGDEMASLFKEYPETIVNTLKIAERCKVTLPKQKPQVPEFTIPNGFASSSAYLRELVMQGIEKRYQNNNIAKERAECELEIITRMGFSDYFLIVADCVKWALEQGIPVSPGHGAASSSITAYALGITCIDPLRYQLPFEYFINPDLTTIPDIDMCFSDERRDEVIAYLTEKYGKERVARIIIFGVMKGKKVYKDVAWALNISTAESDMITKLIPDQPITLQMEINPKYFELEKDPRYAELFNIADKLEGLHYFSSLHTAGIVISKSPLAELVPLCQGCGDSKSTFTQYSMIYLEDCGLVKTDIFGLKTLDVIKHTEELIRRKGAEYADFSVQNILENDQATFKMLSAIGTKKKPVSITHLSTKRIEMQDLLNQAEPASIEDLIALNAMYSPAFLEYLPLFSKSKLKEEDASVKEIIALKSQYNPDFFDTIPLLIKQKNKEEHYKYLGCNMDDILKETYGIIVYQEQVIFIIQLIFIIQRISGYSLREADLLRRTLMKQNQEQINNEKERFIMASEKNKFERSASEQIFNELVYKSSVALSKSYALADTLIEYQTAYLKTHFMNEYSKAENERTLQKR